MSKLSIWSESIKQTIIPFTELKGIKSVTNGVKFTLKDDSSITIKGDNPTNDYVKVAYKIQSDWLRGKQTGIYSCKEKIAGKMLVNVWYDPDAF